MLYGLLIVGCINLLMSLLLWDGGDMRSSGLLVLVIMYLFRLEANHNALLDTIGLRGRGHK